jgi:hypothetical protein
MAVLNRKEEKLQVVLGRLPKTYTDEEFVAMFIKLYSKDWGKIRSAYIKQSQDKEPGTVINMPKPELYLKQILQSFLQKKNVTPAAVAPVVETTAVPLVEKTKKAVTKTKAVPVIKEAPVVAKKTKKVSNKTTVEIDETILETKKTKKVTPKKASTPAKPKAIKA